MTLSTDENNAAAIKPGQCRGCNAEILFVQMGPRKDTIATYPISSRIQRVDFTRYPGTPLLSKRPRHGSDPNGTDLNPAMR